MDKYTLEQINIKCYNFAKNATIGWQTHHGIEHARDVANITSRICYDLPLEQQKQAIVIAYCHDLRDHKMINNGFACISENELRNFIEEIGLNSDDILAAINAISFSKERAFEKQDINGNYIPGTGYKYLMQTVPRYLHTVRNAVSDADKILALGEKGIDRCFSYRKDATGEDTPMSDIIEHCHEKLLLLLPKYIHTDIGKKIAKPQHDYIVKFVNDNL